MDVSLRRYKCMGLDGLDISHLPAFQLVCFGYRCVVTVLRAYFAQIKKRIKVERLLYTGVHCQDGIANAPRGTIGERGHSHLCCQN